MFKRLFRVAHIGNSTGTQAGKCHGTLKTETQEACCIPYTLAPIRYMASTSVERDRSGMELNALQTTLPHREYTYNNNNLLPSSLYLYTHTRTHTHKCTQYGKRERFLCTTVMLLWYKALEVRI